MGTRDNGTKRWAVGARWLASVLLAACGGSDESGGGAPQNDAGVGHDVATNGDVSAREDAGRRDTSTHDGFVQDDGAADGFVQEGGASDGFAQDGGASDGFAQDDARDGAV